MKHLVDIEETGVVQVPQNFGVGFEPKYTLACFDDGPSEPATYLSIIAG